jgi:hypothetical protein
LIILAENSLDIGSVLVARQLLILAVSEASSALDKSYALRLLGRPQIRWIGSSEIRAAGIANFQRALNLEAEYPDLKQVPELGLYTKVVTAMAWAAAVRPTACNEAQLFVKSDKRYLSEAPVAVRLTTEARLKENGVPVSNGTILAPPGCSPTSDR